MSLMVSISGIRGVVGKTLTPEVLVKYASAFAEFCDRGKIVIGRDGRVTGKMMDELVTSTLLAMGCDVVSLGVAPTPTIQIAVEQLHASGGISVTASHNPMEWNGLKFISDNGMFLTANENERFWSIAESQPPAYADWHHIGRHTEDDSFLRQHDDMVLNLPLIDVEKIRSRRFKVVLDCINSAGGYIVPQLLRSLGCTVIEMNCEVSGIFAHMPEPIPENLGELCARVVAEKADMGIAVDPDVDRLVLITERGEPYGEEYTITTVVKHMLEKSKRASSAGNVQPVATVVVNLSTTRAVEDIVTAFGGRLIQTPVGEINVAQKMQEVGALVGGEGSGGVIVPQLHYGRDAIIGIGIVLEQFAEFSGSVSQFKATLPLYSILKTKIDLAGKDPDELLARVRRKFEHNGNVNSEDGLRINMGRTWVHLRKSNTEPIMRIIAEAPTTEEAETLVQKFRDELLTA